VGVVGANIFQLGSRKWIEILQWIEGNAYTTGLGMDAKRALEKSKQIKGKRVEK
jgi:hypothetical protein